MQRQLINNGDVTGYSRALVRFGETGRRLSKGACGWSMQDKAIALSFFSRTQVILLHDDSYHQGGLCRHGTGRTAGKDSATVAMREGDCYGVVGAWA